MTQRDVEQFNARAERYDQSVFGRRFHRPIHQAVLQIAARLTPEPRAILDVGCGTGSLLRLAAARFPEARLWGVDPAEQMLAVAKASMGGEPRVQLVCAGAERLPFDDAAFDLVVSSNSFHHWVDQAGGMAEIGRVLAPNGCLVMTDPFAVGWLRPWATLVRRRERMRSRSEVEAMLRTAGLETPAWEAVFGLGPITTFFAVTARRP
ncbi:MAG: class I SAM-dependent methyltransferase [Candidatus Limnocylindrales bacterium]